MIGFIYSLYHINHIHLIYYRFILYSSWLVACLLPSRWWQGTTCSLRSEHRTWCLSYMNVYSMSLGVLRICAEYLCLCVNRPPFSIIYNWSFLYSLANTSTTPVTNHLLNGLDWNVINLKNFNDGIMTVSNTIYATMTMTLIMMMMMMMMMITIITSRAAVVPRGASVAPVVRLSSTLASVRARLVVSLMTNIRTNI